MSDRPDSGNLVVAKAHFRGRPRRSLLLARRASQSSAGSLLADACLWVFRSARTGERF
jgi:hypothetical protein